MWRRVPKLTCGHVTFINGRTRSPSHHTKQDVSYPKTSEKTKTQDQHFSEIHLNWKTHSEMALWLLFTSTFEQIMLIIYIMWQWITSINSTALGTEMYLFKNTLHIVRKCFSWNDRSLPFFEKYLLKVYFLADCAILAFNEK